MTQTAPSRRPGGLGVHSLDHFSLTVPDVSAAGEFYGAFGLELRADGEKLGLYTAGTAHRWGVLTEGPRKQLHHIAFGAFAEDFPQLRDRIEQSGILRLDPPPGFDSDGLWFRDLDGTLLEVRVAEKSSPDRKASFENSSVSAGERGAPYRRAGSRTFFCLPPMSAKRSLSTGIYWGSGSRIAPGITSPSCMASTAATIT